MKIKKLSPKLEQLCRAAFPSYRGRKWKLHAVPSEKLECLSYWDSGSKSDFVLINLATLDSRRLPDTNPFQPRPDPVQIPTGWAIVESRIFLGKPSGLSIHCLQTDLEPLKVGCEEAE